MLNVYLEFFVRCFWSKSQKDTNTQENRQRLIDNLLKKHLMMNESNKQSNKQSTESNLLSANDELIAMNVCLLVKSLCQSKPIKPCTNDTSTTNSMSCPLNAFLPFAWIDQWASLVVQKHSNKEAVMLILIEMLAELCTWCGCSRYNWHSLKTPHRIRHRNVQTDLNEPKDVQNDLNIQNEPKDVQLPIKTKASLTIEPSHSMSTVSSSSACSRCSTDFIQSITHIYLRLAADHRPLIRMVCADSWIDWLNCLYNILDNDRQGFNQLRCVLGQFSNSLMRWTIAFDGLPSDRSSSIGQTSHGVPCWMLRIRHVHGSSSCRRHHAYRAEISFACQL